VAFPESFWVVLGAAAPVVALASVVALNETYSQNHEWRRRTFARLMQADDQGAAGKLVGRDLQDAWDLYRMIGRMHSANIVAQAALLGSALISLARGSDLVPPYVGAVAEVAGLAVVAFAAMNSRRAASVGARALSLADWEVKLQSDRAAAAAEEAQDPETSG
jgi:hypothetical protein